MSPSPTGPGSWTRASTRAGREAAEAHAVRERRSVERRRGRSLPALPPGQASEGGRSASHRDRPDSWRK